MENGYGIANVQSNFRTYVQVEIEMFALMFTKLMEVLSVEWVGFAFVFYGFHRKFFRCGRINSQDCLFIF